MDITPTPPTFPPTRAAGLERLAAFLPRAGRDYAALRNYDLPGHPHVSGLAPYVRHRLVTEDEVLAAVLGRYSLSTAEKFVQEVFWRTYWKGWLEMRPGVWADYRRGLKGALNRVQTEGGLRADWEAACRGETGLAGFDDWARDLVATGYLHNHARMWFASIWVFTLRLPWELGADFFLRHLLDGDPASNTLGWRWVAGIQTAGKTYAATAANIAKYTEGRVTGLTGLPGNPSALPHAPAPPPMALPLPEAWDPGARTGLVLTEDDLSPGWLLDRLAADGIAPVASAVLLSDDARSPLAVSPLVTGFTDGAVADALARHAGRLGSYGGAHRGDGFSQALVEWAQGAGLTQVVAPHAPAGPSAERLGHLGHRLGQRGIRLLRVMRPFDRAAWPHATHGFFRFKDAIPRLVRDLNLARAA
jgi:deoxyribodipyrimidine photo-lyase